jgi:hypothetical protein
MKNIRPTKDGKCFQAEETGPKGGRKTWFTARAEGQGEPGARALWCLTKREALENSGAANVAIGI